LPTLYGIIIINELGLVQLIIIFGKITLANSSVLGLTKKEISCGKECGSPLFGAFGSIEMRQFLTKQKWMWLKYFP